MLAFPFLDFGQNTPKLTLSGYVKDGSTSEAMIGAAVTAVGTNSGAITNEYGYFSISLPKGSYTIQISYLGYDVFSETLELSDNVKRNFEIIPSGKVTTEEIQVSAEKEDQNVTGSQMSVNKMDIQTVKQLPAFFGEADIIKAVQLLPGIKSAGDGLSGFYVRGGGADQNLILLDEATVYNASHLLGFFSVFNGDAIKDLNLYKGAIPAQYGGRLSSVMDIRMNEGNMKKFSAQGGIGILSSRLTLQGPIKKEKGSFIVSGRRTYADVFLKLSPELKDNSLYFYDFNAKANYELGPKDRIFISGYFGQDKFKFGDIFSQYWGNRTFTARWNHLFGNKLFSNLSFIFSDFYFGFSVKANEENFKYSSGIRNYGLRWSLDYFLNDKNHVKFGLESTSQTFQSGKVEITGQSNLNDFSIPKNHGLENGIYIQNEQTITKRLSFNYGLRYNLFFLLGPGNVYTWNNAETKFPTDTTTYTSGELMKTYHGLEPRFSFAYRMNESSAVKGSYSRTRQNVHQVSSGSASLPTDIWIPSTTVVKPQIADQVAIGYFKNFKDNMFETSIELYYKKMYNQIEFKNGSDAFLNPYLDNSLAFGEAWSYGSEFFIKKSKGKTIGWISYTLSKTERKFDLINDGEPYPARYDRRHDLSVVVNRVLSKRWVASAIFVYRTGDAVTLPSGKYIIDGQVVPYYESRNSYRMPDYHRLDLSATLNGKPGKKFESSWNFSVYNAYGRKNPFSYSFTTNPETGEIEAKKIFLFTIIPSITWNFKF